jgi:hypothetical protein
LFEISSRIVKKADKLVINHVIKGLFSGWQKYEILFATNKRSPLLAM